MKPDIALIEQSYIGAVCSCPDIADFHVAQVGRKPLHREGLLQPAVQRRQRNRIILRESRDVLNQDMAASLAQVDAVCVLYQNLIVFFALQAMVLIAVFINSSVVCAKVDVPDISVPAIDEVQRPPPLIAAG